MLPSSCFDHWICWIHSRLCYIIYTQSCYFSIWSISFIFCWMAQGEPEPTRNRMCDWSYRNTLLLFSVQLLQHCRIMKDSHMYPVLLDYTFFWINRARVYFYLRLTVCSADCISFTVSLITVQFEQVEHNSSLGMTAATKEASIEFDLQLYCSHSK